MSVSVSLSPLEDGGVIIGASFITQGSLRDFKLKEKKCWINLLFLPCVFISNVAKVAQSRKAFCRAEVCCGKTDPTGSCFIIRATSHMSKEVLLPMTGSPSGDAQQVN